MLCGSVLSVWTKVEGVLASVSGTNIKMQSVRLRTEDGQRIVGKLMLEVFGQKQFMKNIYYLVATCNVFYQRSIVHK